MAGHEKSEGDIRPDLVAYLDGELPAEGRARVDAALAKDPALRSELRLLEATGRLLARMDAPPSPAPGLVSRVRERIRREEAGAGAVGGSRVLRAPTAGAPSWRRAVPYAAAAAILLGGIGIAWSLSRGGAGAPDEATPSSVARSSAGPSAPRPDPFQPLEPREALPPPSIGPTRSSGGSALARGPEEGAAGGIEGADPEDGGSATARGGAGEGIAPEADGAPPELLAKLDLIEDLDLLETLDVIDALDDPEDPLQDLDEENG